MTDQETENKPRSAPQGVARCKFVAEGSRTPRAAFYARGQVDHRSFRAIVAGWGVELALDDVRDVHARLVPPTKDSAGERINQLIEAPDGGRGVGEFTLGLVPMDG